MITVGLNSNEKDCRIQVGNTNIITNLIKKDMKVQIYYYFYCD